MDTVRGEKSFSILNALKIVLFKFIQAILVRCLKNSRSTPARDWIKVYQSVSQNGEEVGSQALKVSSSNVPENKRIRNSTVIPSELSVSLQNQYSPVTLEVFDVSIKTIKTWLAAGILNPAETSIAQSMIREYYAKNLYR